MLPVKTIGSDGAIALRGFSRVEADDVDTLGSGRSVLVMDSS